MKELGERDICTSQDNEVSMMLLDVLSRALGCKEQETGSVCYLELGTKREEKTAKVPP